MCHGKKFHKNKNPNLDQHILLGIASKSGTLITGQIFTLVFISMESFTMYCFNSYEITHRPHGSIKLSHLCPPPPSDWQWRRNAELTSMCSIWTWPFKFCDERFSTWVSGLRSSHFSNPRSPRVKTKKKQKKLQFLGACKNILDEKSSPSKSTLFFCA